MKKWLALLLALILIPTCSIATEEVATGIDQFGNECLIYIPWSVTNNELYQEIKTDSLPFTIPYGKNELTTLSVDFYRVSTERGDYPLCHLTLDAKQLTKKEKNSW